MVNFKYDVITFIKLIESRPIIWDKTLEESKSKTVRERHWKEICSCLDKNYAEMNKHEKETIKLVCMTKWAHIRDAFLRSIRTKQKQGLKTNYKYSEYLQFLVGTPNYPYPPLDPLEFGFDEHINDSDSESSQYMQPVASTSNEEVFVKEEVNYSMDQIDQTNSSEPEVKKEKLSGPSSSQTDQEMMLMSFLPYIRDMDEMELMDLNMTMLKAIKEIKQRRLF